MPTTYECFSFGLLATNNDGDNLDKCLVASSDVFGTATVPDEDLIEDLCKSLCGDCGCPYIETVFNGDFTYLYVEQEVDTDVIEFEIVRKNNGVGEVINDQSLGVWVSNKSLALDWSLVQTKYGNGFYNILINYNILGVEKTVESHDFQLLEFDRCAAKDQVKFIWSHEGSILDGRVFEEKTIYESRLKGNMIELSPETEKETYQNNNRQILTTEFKVVRKYEFKSKLLNFEQKEMIVTNLALGDVFDVTQYTNNSKKFENKILKLDEISGFEDLESSNYYTIKLSFTDYNDTLIKRPCT